MSRYILAAFATFSLTTFAQDPVPTPQASEDAYALARSTYTPELHAKQIDAAFTATAAKLATLKDIEVDADKLKMVFVQLLDYQELVDFQAGLYAKYYTVDEMAALAKFYSTPLGKKSLSVIPQLTQDIAGWMMQRMSIPETEKMLKSALRKATFPTEKGAGGK